MKAFYISLNLLNLEFNLIFMNNFKTLKKIIQVFNDSYKQITYWNKIENRSRKQKITPDFFKIIKDNMEASIEKRVVVSDI